MAESGEHLGSGQRPAFRQAVTTAAHSLERDHWGDEPRSETVIATPARRQKARAPYPRSTSLEQSRNRNLGALRVPGQMVRPIFDTPGADFLALQQALVGRYSLERELGRGGMGLVYLAHEVALDRPVALKLLPPAYAAEPSHRERFLREARTAAKLSHPHIVPIHAVDEVDDFVFFAMAYIDGETLGERVRNRGPLRGKEAVRVLREVAWALAYAHAEGVIHRDVKPDNILLERDSGRALVTDFGIAQVGHEPRTSGSEEVLGTAEFMSPEQAAAGEVGGGADLYSLGAVGFYSLTGRFPFEANSSVAVLAKHVTEPAPPVASVAPEVPTKLAHAIDRCLRKSPEDRFPDGGALAEALGQGTDVARQLPIPVRVFINRVRGMASAVPLFLILWMVIVMIPLLLGETGSPVPILPLVVSLSIGLPLAALGLYARRLLAAGYGIDDARRGLQADVERHLEEIRFEFGKGFTTVDKFLRVLTWGAFSVSIPALFAGIWSGSEDLFFLFVGSVDVGILSAIFAGFRNKRQRDRVGETLLSLLKGKVGDWMFKLGGIGLGAKALSAGGAHRPTEVAIGLAADRLFDELPKSLKRELKGLPETVRRLEADAKSMRQQVEELSTVLAEIGDDTERVGAEERVELRADVEETRDEAKNRMTDAVSALETIRLGLLRLHAGDGNVETLTLQLGSARDVSADIERLLEGQDEVDRILSRKRHTRQLSGSHA